MNIFPIWKGKTEMKKKILWEGLIICIELFPQQPLLPEGAGEEHSRTSEKANT